jgi:hypothetical protein
MVGYSVVCSFAFAASSDSYLPGNRIPIKRIWWQFASTRWTELRWNWRYAECGGLAFSGEWRNSIPYDFGVAYMPVAIMTILALGAIP